MRLLLALLLVPVSIAASDGRELLDAALEKCIRLQSLEPAGTYSCGTEFLKASRLPAP